MNKKELISNVTEKANVSKKIATEAVDAVFESIMDALSKGDRVQLAGFGTFEVRERAAREGLNPRTKEKISVPACKTPAFKAGKQFKDTINK